MKLPKHELLKEKLFCWMGEAEMDILTNCFDIEEEWIPKERIAAVGNRIGYLLSGSALLSRGKDVLVIARSTVF
ncbi:MAG: hypothetical protein PUC44_01460 [Eubacteriales bacterium]|nr:hypothetical protein [Eubacteriales bacterium]